MGKNKEYNNDYIQLSALNISQNDWCIYAFTIPAKELFSLVQINQRDTDKNEGYQRALSPSRVKEIAKYIDDGRPIPNSLLVAFSEESYYDEYSCNIFVPNKSDAGWVIDGQHRLAGASQAISDIEFIVVGFIGLDINQQIEQFVTINKEAKGVPSSLYYDLLKELPKQISDKSIAQERASDISKRLRNDEESPFFGRITIQAPRKGELSLTNFVRKVAPLVTPHKGKFNLYTFEEQVGILNNYYKSLKIVFPDYFKGNKQLFFSTLGFGAMINALPIVFDYSIKLYGGFTIDNIVNVLLTIEHFDFDSWKQFGSGNQAEVQAGNDLITELRDSLSKSDEESSTLKL